MRVLIVVLLCMIYSCESNFSTSKSKNTIDDRELHTEIQSDSANHQLVQTKYFKGDTLYLIETSYDEGVTNLDVKDKSLFLKYYFNKKNKKYAGVSLYSIYCMPCHSGYPFLKDSLNVDSFFQPTILKQLLFNSNHSRLDTSILDEVNDYEIEAISSYILRN
ncbi:MAG: hypothetical protein H6577_11740 [Lewinellaceae bacterium]|nr:hypothetical protein [Saprospiraceae bacterium]MCB9338789.1 hypothetical protein [Lewinellaceae bacterium]